MIFEISLDDGFEFADASEHAAPDLLFGHQAEEPFFDLVEP
jgi:hypothetical protein